MNAAPKTTTFRFTEELISRVEAYAARLATETGVPVNRTAAAAKLLTDRLDQLEAEAKKKPKK